MIYLRSVATLLCFAVLTACDVPQPGDADYERYVQSKSDRDARMFEGF